MPATQPATSRTTPTRVAKRVFTDRDLINRILDEALVCHLAFTAHGEPRILPTLHARLGDILYLHASTGSRPMLAARRLADGLPVCVAVTLLDGLVLSKSQFDHDANYRSVVIHGRGRLVTDPVEKRRALTALVEHMVPGRAADSRPPTDRELAQTAVLAIPLDEATAKIRAGGVGDEGEDLALPHWTGVIPLRLVADDPIPSGEGAPVPLPAYLHGYRRGGDPHSKWYQPAPLAGERVRLEPLESWHADDLLEAGKDPEVWRWLSSPQPQDIQQMRRYIIQALEARGRRERIPWVIIDQVSGRAVGTTSYYEIDPVHRSLAIGFTWLGKDWWGTGLNAEAKLMLLRRAFDDLGALRVAFHTDVRNDRSQRAIERLGARREGVFCKHRIRPDGTLRDTVQYAITDDEWPAVRTMLQRRLAARQPSKGGTGREPDVTS